MSSEVRGIPVVGVEDDAIVIVVRLYPLRNGGGVPGKEVSLNLWNCTEQVPCSEHGKPH
jgi:hypothetical protein